MNNKLVKISTLIGAVMSLVIAACGPQDMNEMNLAPEANAQEQNQGEGPAQAQDGAPAQAQDGAPAQAQDGGCPTGGCPTGGCAGGDCQVPPNPDTARNVQHPDQVTTEQTRLTRTGEKQLATNTVDYHTTHHVLQPHETQHTVEQHTRTINRHHKKVVFHPSTRKITSVFQSASSEDQVMPTKTEVAPLKDEGCSFAQPAPAPAPAPVVQPVVQPVVYPVYLLRTYLPFGMSNLWY